MNLRYCLYTANYKGEHRHPQKVMLDLGIDYEEAIPQSIADQWWFINCTNVPRSLPKYLSEM